MVPPVPKTLGSGLDSGSVVTLSSYRAFGLNVCSELEFSGVSPGSGVADVYVRLGSVPEQLENAGARGVFYQATDRQLLLNVRHVARYLISSGNEILVDVAPGADQGMVSLLLFGSAFGALLHQRRVLALHGSAIATRHGAMVFAGASGHGKSTLAGVFQQRGFPVLADDVCPIETRAFPTVLPANPFLMLWADAANRLGIDERHLRRTRTGLEKFILPLGDNYAVEPTPLHAIYILEPSNLDSFSVTPIHGIRKIRTLCLNTYRPQFVDAMNLDSQHFRQVSSVARQTRISVVKRPIRGFRVDELADLLAADFPA